MLSLAHNDTAEPLRRGALKLTRRAKRLTRYARENAKDIAHSAKRQSRAVARSMRKHPIAWTSAGVGLGAAAITGLLLLRRRELI